MTNHKELVHKFTEKVKLSSEEIVIETRRRFFMTLKGLYWHIFEHRQCFGYSVLTLMHSANRGLDCTTEVMTDWVKLEPIIFPRRLICLLNCGTNRPRLAWIFRKWLYSYVTQAYDVGRSFISAHVKAKEVLDEMEIDIDERRFEEVMNESEE